MINDWLDHEELNPSPYVFRIINISEKEAQSDALKSFLGKQIVNSYRDLDFLKDTFSNRPQNELENHLKNYVFPSDKAQIHKNVSQGDFGEILAGLIVSKIQGLVVPIQKLRWKFNHNKSVFCTDMIAHNDGVYIENIHYYEIKTRLLVRKETVNEISNHVTVNAHNSLLKDENAPNEGIADFISRLCYEKADYENYLKYSAIVNNPNNYNRIFELFFIIDESKYKDKILDDLENLPPTLNPLRVTVVLIKSLGRLIVTARQKAIEEAVNYVYTK